MKLGTLKPWTIIGFRKDGRPIHLIAGGAADDDDDDTGIDLEGGSSGTGRGRNEDEEDDDEAEEQDDAKGKPAAKAVTQADLDRAMGALEKERAAAKEARGKLRDLQAQLREAKKGADGAAKSDQDAAAKAAEDAAAAAENRYKPMIVNEAAKAALFAAGLDPETKPAALKALLRMVDMTEVDVDEDGVSGLEDQIDQIKDTLPALFAKPEPAPTPRPVRAPKIDAAGRKNETPAPKTTGELYAARILGNG